MTRIISLAALTVLELTPLQMVECAANDPDEERLTHQFATGTARRNAGVLIDAFHFSRSRSRLEDVAAIPPSRLRYLQLCDVPEVIPETLGAILVEARAERLFPGEGQLDLMGLLRALPRDIPLSLEVPTLTLAKTVGATERARRALAATKRVLAASDELSLATRR
jgi:sugar phosphate isomerase/epimerase